MGQSRQCKEGQQCNFKLILMAITDGMVIFGYEIDSNGIEGSVNFKQWHLREV